MSDQISHEEKYKRTKEFFSRDLGISPPISVMNSLKDVFDETDKIDSVDFFFKDGIADLEQELTLENILNIEVNGQSSGTVNEVYTYYGRFNISLSETTVLTNNGELLSKVTEIDNKQNLTKLNDPDDYAIILITQYNFENGVLETKDSLRIYVPMTEEEIDG